MLRKQTSDKDPEELTEDFFAQHYPGADTTDIGKNYEMLSQEAEKLIALIKQSLPQYFQKPSN